MYGAGYYYIPGTETCLSIAGLVRYQISFDDRDDGWRKNAYARLDINAKSETEYGTLTGYIRFAATSADVGGLPGTPDVYMEYATISLGGLSMGLSDSLYDVDVGAEFDVSGGPRVHFINYTFDAGNGFSATVALEEENNNVDYVPNVVGRIGVSQGWGTADLYVTYNDDDDGLWVDDAFTVKGVVAYKINPTITLTAMGIYESDLGYYSTGYEWSAAAFLEAQVSDRVSVGFGGQYFGNEFDGLGGTLSLDQWRVGGEVGYKITDGFATKLQVQYRDIDDGIAGTDDGHVEGWLRFERSF
ncbi:hypothetical protein ASD64_05050 [Mesorhizobium sp. Root157]|nr:hypothetical protein ASD64_05050 [Mesorhizobium sp. Root157]